MFCLKKLLTKTTVNIKKSKRYQNDSPNITTAVRKNCKTSKHGQKSGKVKKKQNISNHS